MKKLIALLLALAMTLSMAACGASAPTPTEAPKADAPAATPAEPAAPAEDEKRVDVDEMDTSWIVDEDPTAVSGTVNFYIPFKGSQGMDAMIAAFNEISEKTSKRAEQEKHLRKDESGVMVDGLDNLMIRMANCCSPVPGDEIIGYITKGRGITVHRKDCDNIKALPPEERDRLIEVVWDPDKTETEFAGEVCIITKDQKGMISNISKICEDMDVRIIGLNAREYKDETYRIDLKLMVKNKDQIEKICRSFKNIPGIVEAYRLRA